MNLLNRGNQVQPTTGVAPTLLTDDASAFTLTDDAAAFTGLTPG